MSSLVLALFVVGFFLDPRLAILLALAVPISRDTEPVGLKSASTPRIIVGALGFSLLFLFVLGAFHVATRRRAPQPAPAIHLPPYPSQGARTATPALTPRAIPIHLTTTPDSSASEIDLRVSEPSSPSSSVAALPLTPPPPALTADHLRATQRHGYDRSSTPSVSGSEPSSGSSAGGSAPPSPSSPALQISAVDMTITRFGIQ